MPRLPRYRLELAWLLSLLTFPSCRAVSSSLHASEYRASEPSPLSDVPPRMQYWKRWEAWLGKNEEPSKAPTKYLLFDPDLGGLNNIRLSWEVAGLIAHVTGRTLVLPPAAPWYLIDFGPEYFKPAKAGSVSRVEDFINLSVLRKGMPVLTFEEFAKEEVHLPVALNDPALPQQWKTYARDHFTALHAEGKECDLETWDRPERVVYAQMLSATDGRLFGCTSWWELGEIELKKNSMKYQAPPAARALIHGGFVWHEEAFQLAAHIVKDLGLFEYSAVHARFGDFQFSTDKQDAHAISEKWFMSDYGRRLTGGRPVYISTDNVSEVVINAFRDRGIKASWSKDYFENPKSPIADLLKEKGAVRVQQLKGPVEQLVCAFGRLFMGTGHSTFSGYINRMRLSADAPQTHVIHHTDDLTEDLAKSFENSVSSWQSRRGFELTPALSSDEVFLQVPVRAAMLHMREDAKQVALLESDDTLVSPPPPLLRRQEHDTHTALSVDDKGMLNMKQQRNKGAFAATRLARVAAAPAA